MGYDPDQPRVPAGKSTGGQWTKTGAGTSSTKSANKIDAAARDAAGVGQRYTDEIYYNKNTGQWTPERAKLHQEIEDSFFKGKTPVENPVSILMGGGSGAGKSSMIRDGAVTIPDNHVEANADKCKELLPEYEGGKNAHLVHEESSYLYKRVLDRAAREKYNVVLDGTGNKSVESANKKVDMMSPHGQKVDAYYATCSIESALERAVIRQRKSGRYVPPEVVIETHKGVSKMFPDLIKRSKLNNIYLYDTNAKPAKLIFSKVNGVTKVVDPVAFRAFLDKAKWTPGGEF